MLQEAQKILNEEKARKAIEACLGDGVAFSVQKTAKILDRSPRWVREKIDEEKLQAVRIGRKISILRPEIMRILMEGVGI